MTKHVLLHDPVSKATRSYWLHFLHKSPVWICLLLRIWSRSSQFFRMSAYTTDSDLLIRSLWCPPEWSSCAYMTGPWRREAELEAWKPGGLVRGRDRSDDWSDIVRVSEQRVLPFECLLEHMFLLRNSMSRTDFKIRLGILGNCSRWYTEICHTILSTFVFVLKHL